MIQAEHLSKTYVLKEKSHLFGKKKVMPPLQRQKKGGMLYEHSNYDRPSVWFGGT